jgi:hypothetical protein
VGLDAGGVDAAFIINLYGGRATLAEGVRPRDLGCTDDEA